MAKRKSAAVAQTSEVADIHADLGFEAPATPTKKRRTSTKTSKTVVDVEGAEITPSSTRTKRAKPAAQVDAEVEASPARRSSRPRKVVSMAEEQEDGEAGDGEGPTPKKRRRKKTDEPVVYDIPPVERKKTTFKGRLGYACLNTILRAEKPESIFCSRTCRLDTIAQKGLDFAKELGLKNAEDLYKMIEWNEANKIRFMRVSSDMFPFASHAVNGYSLDYAQYALERAGELARRLGHRLTMHPGQFTQLGSNKEAVIKASVRELNYQCEILDRMGMGDDSVMIIHMGGVYGDKPSTLARFKESYRTLLTDGVRKRLVIENDELCYNVDDLLPVSEELGIPIVLDYHHDWIYPSSRPVSELIPLINKVWERKGIKPKQHLSEPRPGAVSVIEKRAHADRCQTLPADLPDDMDLMIEAKDKEQAVFHLWRIYGLEEPIWESLRPPAAVQELATKGRKSPKKKKKQMGDATLEEPDKEGDERALVENDGNDSELTELEDV